MRSGILVAALISSNIAAATVYSESYSLSYGPPTKQPGYFSTGQLPANPGGRGLGGLAGSSVDPRTYYEYNQQIQQLKQQSYQNWLQNQQQQQQWVQQQNALQQMQQQQQRYGQPYANSTPPTYPPVSQAYQQRQVQQWQLQNNSAQQVYRQWGFIK